MPHFDLQHLDPAPLVSLFALLAFGAVVGFLTVLSRKGRTEDQARAYLAGVTYVISDDPDAAIAELSRAAQLRSEALETYFALGALFRRKGELDRAIRLHSNMLLRPGLSPEVRRRAELALALDYRSAGLKDKAMEALSPQVSSAGAAPVREALVLYRQLLEDAGRWEDAIAVQVRVATDGEGKKVLAHLLAARSRAVAAEEPAEAERWASRAVQTFEASADAQLALAEAHLARGNPGAAVEPLQRALELEPELSPMGVGLLVRAGADPARVEAFLSAQIAKAGPLAMLYELALALHHKAHGRDEVALARLRGLVERNPRFWEARREVGALLLAHGRSEELKADYVEILGRLGQPALSFGCGTCRQKLTEHLFRCPSCHSWGTVRREEPNVPGSRI